MLHDLISAQKTEEAINLAHKLVAAKSTKRKPINSEQEDHYITQIIIIWLKALRKIKLSVIRDF